MKRRGFLGLLGLAPAAPLIAKELAKPAIQTSVPVVDITKQDSSQPTVRYEPKAMFAECTMGYMASATLVAIPKHRWEGR